MRFLADVGISPATIEFLLDQGHDATHVRNIGLQRASDREIVDLALGVLDRPSVIILRPSDERPASVNRRLITVISERSEDLASGPLILIEDDRYRGPEAPHWWSPGLSEARVPGRPQPRATVSTLKPGQFP